MKRLNALLPLLPLLASSFAHSASASVCDTLIGQKAKVNASIQQSNAALEEIETLKGDLARAMEKYKETRNIILPMSAFAAGAALWWIADDAGEGYAPGAKKIITGTVAAFTVTAAATGFVAYMDYAAAQKIRDAITVKERAYAAAKARNEGALQSIERKLAENRCD